MTRSFARIGLSVAIALVLGACGLGNPDVRTVGVIEAVQPPLHVAFVDELARLGWVDGENLDLISIKIGDGVTAEAAAEELVDAGVEVIFAPGAQAAGAAIAAADGTDIDVVVMVASNLRSQVEAGGATGLIGRSAPGRTIELASQAVPIERLLVPVLDDAASKSSFEFLDFEVSALGVEVVRVDVATPDALIELVRSEGGEFDAVMHATTAALSPHFKAIADAALEAGVPYIASSGIAALGGFMSYGWLPAENGRQGAVWVDTVLDGTKAEDIPFGLFPLFLSFNTETAEALGIEIPKVILDQADLLYP